MALTLKNLTDELKKRLGNYFNPESNQGKNFWSSKFGSRTLPKVQQKLEASRNLPKISVDKYIPRVQTGYKPVDFAMNLPRDLAVGIGEGVINSPIRAWESGARIGYDIGNKVPQTPIRTLYDIAPLATGLTDVYGFGAGKQILKQGAKQLAKKTFIKAVG